jgi:hypothetical protein
MKDITQVFIANLMKFAKSKDITITRLCEIIDVSLPSFYRWKAGKSNMQMNTAQEKIDLLSKEFTGENEEDYQLSWFLMESQE